MTTQAPRVLVLACGALARELIAIFDANGLDNVTLECLPGEYHMRPEKIVPALEERLSKQLAERSDDGKSDPDDRYDQVLIGYGDCGTSGALDRFCDDRGFDRIPGEHCYQFFAGADRFLELHDDEPGTFYLTDYLAKHFDLFVIKALGIDRHPELAEVYFGNYQRLIYLRQIGDSTVEAKARVAAQTLGLEFQMIETGYGELESSVVDVAVGRPQQPNVHAEPINETELI